HEYDLVTIHLVLLLTVFLLLERRPPISTLFPYTTLFRSASTAASSSPTAGPAETPAVGLDDAAVEAARPVDPPGAQHLGAGLDQDRKSTRLNSSHVKISYAVFCLKKKNKKVRLMLA